MQQRLTEVDRAHLARLLLHLVCLMKRNRKRQIKKKPRSWKKKRNICRPKLTKWCNNWHRSRVLSLTKNLSRWMFTNKPLPKRRMIHQPSCDTTWRPLKITRCNQCSWRKCPCNGKTNQAITLSKTLQISSGQRHHWNKALISSEARSKPFKSWPQWGD